MNGPILKGKRITLRPWKISDAARYAKWYRDKEVMRYFWTSNCFATLEKVKKGIRASYRSQKINFSIENETGAHIGRANLKEMNDNTIRFGLMIGDKTQWGKGYAGEVIELLKDYVFNKLKYNRLDLTVAPGNERAIKAYKKAGFIWEGLMRQYRFNRVAKKIEDEAVMSILKNEYKSK